MQTTRYPNLRIAALAVLFTANAGCAAQPATPALPPVAEWAPPPPGVGPGPLADASIATMQGTVARFLINPDGDVDGFLTDDGTRVRFPPHMSTQLTSAVRRGDQVQLNGTRDVAGSFTARRITDTRSGQQVIDEPPIGRAPPLPRAARGEGLSRLSAQGQVAHVTTAPRGEPDGVILSDGTVIKLPPPVAQRFPDLMRAGATVSAQGYGTRNRYGAAFQATAFGSPGNVMPLYDRNASMP